MSKLSQHVEEIRSARLYERALRADLSELRLLLGDAAYYNWIQEAKLDELVEREGNEFAINVTDGREWLVLISEVWQPSGLLSACVLVQKAIEKAQGLSEGE